MPVKYIGYDLLNRYGMIHKFKVPSATLETFLSRIEEGTLLVHDVVSNVQTLNAYKILVLMGCAQLFPCRLGAVRAQLFRASK